MSDRPFVQCSDYLAILVITAIILAALGAFIAVTAWPNAEVTANECISFESYENCPDEEASASGSRGWSNFGLALVGIGNLVMLIPIVGYGVKLGLRAANNEGTI
jgi:hypothetical protein